MRRRRIVERGRCRDVTLECDLSDRRGISYDALMTSLLSMVWLTVGDGKYNL